MRRIGRKAWCRQGWRSVAIVLWSLLTCLVAAQTPNTIKDVEVRGARNVNQETILAAMSSRAGQPFAQDQLSRDRTAIESLGFFQAVDVRASEMPGEGWKIIVDVVEFAVIKEVRIVGNTVFKTEEIARLLATAPSLPIAPGTIYCLKSVGPAVAAIRKLYSDRGYFVQIDEFGPLPESPETISVHLIEVTVGSIAVQGATRTKPRVLDRLIKTEKGEAFSREKWQEDMRRLWNTQWFESIEPLVRESQEIGVIDLVVDVKEARTGAFNVGLQMDPRSRFAGLLSFSEANFQGTGQSVGLNYTQSAAGGGASVDLNYGNPFFDDHDTAMSLAVYSRIVYRFTGTFGGSETSPTDDRFFERRTGATLGFNRPVRRKTNVILGLRYEGIQTSDLNPDVQEGFIQQDGEVGSLSLAGIFNRRDTDIEPSRGDWLRIQTEPGFAKITKVAGSSSSDGLLGSHTFLRSQIEYRRYWTSQPPREKFDDPRRVVAFRVRYGYISGTVPFFEQFFVGGSDTLRGYPEDRFWGRQMAAMTLEYRHPIQKSFNAVLFADYGAAWGGFGSVGTFSQSDGPDFKLGYGIGFSFRTPLGPIRLDFGFNQDGGSRTHFLIGTSF